MRKEIQLQRKVITTKGGKTNISTEKELRSNTFRFTKQRFMVCISHIMPQISYLFYNTYCKFVKCYP